MTRIAKTLAILAIVANAFCGVPRSSAQQPDAQKAAANAQKPAANTQKPSANAQKPLANGPKPMANRAKPMANAASAPKRGPAATAPKPPAGAQAKAPKPEGPKPGSPNVAAAAKAPKTPKMRNPKLVAAGATPNAPKNEALELVASKRDPFTPLVAVSHGAPSNDHLPPGKAGLVIASVRIDGAVKSATGMIAVLSNPEQRVYFVREGDHLYDGDVEKISLDGITFRESSRDAFGNPVQRLVTKRIYPSAGEQQ